MKIKNKSIIYKIFYGFIINERKANKFVIILKSQNTIIVAVTFNMSIIKL